MIVFSLLLLLLLLLLGSTLAVIEDISQIPIEDISQIPIVDISPLLIYEKQQSTANIDLLERRSYAIGQIHQALERYGLFYISNHSLSDSSASLLEQMEIFFAEPQTIKYSVKRNASNSRGFADDELTQQKRDLKEIFDVGQFPLWTNLSTRALENQRLDGVNLWPEEESSIPLSAFRTVVESHYNSCLYVARILVTAITESLTAGNARKIAYINEASHMHSSFLRLNHYSPALRDAIEVGQALGASGDVGFLGVSPHTDAGHYTHYIHYTHCIH